MLMYFSVQHAVNGSVRIINHRYSHQLSNPYSGEYQTLKLKLETLVCNFEDNFTKTSVEEMFVNNKYNFVSSYIVFTRRKQNCKFHCARYMQWWQNGKSTQTQYGSTWQHVVSVIGQTYPPVQTYPLDTFGLMYESAKHKVCNLNNYHNTKK